MSATQGSYAAVPTPNDTHVSRGYGSASNTGFSDFAQGNPNSSSPLSQSMSNAANNPSAFQDDVDTRGSSSVVEDGAAGGVNRTASTASTAVPASAPSRSNTLKKRNSIKRTSSLKRSSSKRSLKAGSLAGFGGVDSNQEFNSAFSSPVPTQGSPTEILANRFQAWRQLLKSLIAYFREIQASYEIRSKAAHKVQGAIANIAHPAVFMSDHGLGEATKMLDDYHKRSVAEANKSREIENDVIGALTGLRADLGQKIKEIKSLSGDFKNSVEKEKDATRREVEKLQEALQLANRDDGSAMGRGDPFVVKLGVDRAVEKQIDEENYLHRAYLNLESSGRELESIVVGEIQKAYNALAGILKREGDDAYQTVESLRTGPISMPKDAEWLTFVQNDPHFVDPSIPLRRIEDIEYPGKNHPAAAEVRAGMLERKSKYLKSYTPGWYVLSATHLHEFKSADKIYTQPPVMSLYLPDQRLGSHSQPGSSSHKFMLKGRQSGNMHKGHNWVFRAETYDTMLAWFEDIRILTEKSGEERNAFVRKHVRSMSGMSDRGTISSDGMDDEDEADATPYAGDVSSLQQSQDSKPKRPQPGGRINSSDLLMPNRERNVSMGQSSASSDGNEAIAMAGALPGSSQIAYAGYDENPYRLDDITAGERTVDTYNQKAEADRSYFDPTPLPEAQREQPEAGQQSQQREEYFLDSKPADGASPQARRKSSGSFYGDWMAPAGVAAAAGTGAVVAGVYQPKRPEQSEQQDTEQEPEVQDTSKPTSDQSPEANAAILGSRSRDETESSAQVDSAVSLEPLSTTGTELGGLEKEGAHETGSFPTIVRHDTDISISQLHVPGKFPKQS